METLVTKAMQNPLVEETLVSLRSQVVALIGG